MVGDIIEGVTNGTQTIVVDFPMLLATITDVPVGTSISSSFSHAGRSGAFPCTQVFATSFVSIGTVAGTVGWFSLAPMASM
jgi:hypothetical protein